MAETGGPGNAEIMAEIRGLRRDLRAALPEIVAAKNNAVTVMERKRKRDRLNASTARAVARRFPKSAAAE